MQPLARTAMCHLASRFDLYNHHPSQPEFEALQDLLEHFDGMAEGTLEPAYYVSSLDPDMLKPARLSAPERVPRRFDNKRL
jgi:hypothetical protein